MNRRLAVILLSTAMLAGTVATAQEASDSGAKVREAYELTKTAATVEEFNQVLELCNAALDAGVSPTVRAYTNRLKGWTHNKLAEASLDDEKFEEALAHCNTSLDLDNTRWKAYQNRGFCYANAQDFERAIADLTRAIELNSRAERAYVYRGDIRYAQGNYAQAIRDYTDAMRYNSSDSMLFTQRGHAYFMTGQRNRALNDFNRAIDLDDQNVDALVYRGDLHNESGNYRQAANDYRAVFRVSNESDRAFVSAAWMMATCPDERFRNADGAVDTAKKALDLLGEQEHPFRFRYLETLAAAQANAGNFEEASATQAKAIEHAPKSEVEAMQQRKELYDSKQPYRVPAVRQRFR